jgi:hypothetical protein
MLISAPIQWAMRVSHTTELRTISIPAIITTPQKICVPLLFISAKQTLQKSRIQPTFWLDDHGELCGTLHNLVLGRL